MAAKHSITFQNIDNETITEDWYFSLTEADVAKLPFMRDGNHEEKLAEIARNKNAFDWLEILKMVIFASVGRREGNLLIKDEETKRHFEYGGAYTEFFSQLLQSEDAGYGFFKSTLPDRLLKQLEEKQSHEYTEAEMLAMTDEEFEKAFGKDESKYSKELLLIAFRRKASKPATPAA